MAAIVKGSKGKITKIQIDKPLGAASVGQTFLCRLFGPGMPEAGKEVVIKLLRPDVRNRMLREKDVMLQCANDTDKNQGMKGTYEGMLERIEEELDLTIEASNVKKGTIYNSADKNVEAMKLNNIIAPTTTVMVMERAPGVTLDQYIRDTEKEVDEIFKKYITRYKEKGYEPKLNKDGSFVIKLTAKNVGRVHADREALAKKLIELRKRQGHGSLFYAGKDRSSGIFCLCCSHTRGRRRGRPSRRTAGGKYVRGYGLCELAVCGGRIPGGRHRRCICRL